MCQIKYFIKDADRVTISAEAFPEDTLEPICKVFGITLKNFLEWQE